ncbi:single-stranded DNA-binding protein [Corynebacterium callunae]|uniref:single-stranded DNA-binding protein n=1 Tax=Corynebacterium callunae TaxID=1721 RepID=UPI001FFE4A85|nr:single-stranded DNA-binding protein [Corynebacterium callunae]MCK2200505.1 single-stranded DNA-binding protein [Corynebacterium callunae]
MGQGDTIITVVGNVVADPELRFTPSGAAVANFRMASTPRTFNRQSNQWEDGEALFLTVNVWRQAAENVAESLNKGMRVIVTGRLKQRSYETREGEKRSVFEVEADEVGPSLTFAKAEVVRSSQGAQQTRQEPQSQGFGQQQPQGGFGQQQAGGWGKPQQEAMDEPPF